MEKQYTMNYGLLVIKPKGKLVYEYNPLYNFRLKKDTYLKDAEGNFLDAERNILTGVSLQKGSTGFKYGFGYQVTYDKEGNPVYHEGDEKYKKPLVFEEDGMIQDMITGGTSVKFNEESNKYEEVKEDDVLNFSLEHPVDIETLESYDGSVNLILNDDYNNPRLINTRFTPRLNNTYERVDRIGNTDTNIYDKDEFDIDASLFKKYNNIPIIKFEGVQFGGNLKVGNYVFYFKLADGDGNETDFIGLSGIVSVFIGSSPSSIRGGLMNENSYKSIGFTLSNIDSAYDYVLVYYSRSIGLDDTPSNTEAFKLSTRYRIYSLKCNITINGNETTESVDLTTLNEEHFIASKAKTQAICQNMLFLGNVSKTDIPYEKFLELSLLFLPYYMKGPAEQVIGINQYDYRDPFGLNEYYNVDNIYSFVGYWPEEIYRFGVVYIMEDGSTSPVFNIRGIGELPDYSTLLFGLDNEFDPLKDKEGYTESIPYIKNTKARNYLNDHPEIKNEYKYPYLIYEYSKNQEKPIDTDPYYTGDPVIDRDNFIINEGTLENAAGVVLFPKMEINTDGIDSSDEKAKEYGNLPLYALNIRVSKKILEKLKELKVKGYYFVRQKRIPLILAQAFTMPVDKKSGLPLIYNQKYINEEGDTEDEYLFESFLNVKGTLDEDYDDRMRVIKKCAKNTFMAICPEYELNSPYYNSLFNGGSFTVRPVTGVNRFCLDERQFYNAWNNSLKVAEDPKYSKANIISIPDSTPAIRCDGFTFKTQAGTETDLNFESLSNSASPKASNFEHFKEHKTSVWTWIGLGLAVVAAVIVTIYAPAIGVWLGGFVNSAIGAVLGSSIFITLAVDTAWIACTYATYAIAYTTVAFMLTNAVRYGNRAYNYSGDLEASSLTEQASSLMVHPYSNISEDFGEGDGKWYENKVYIARGKYGPLIGLTKANGLKPNLLINIYAPGYTNGSKLDRFKIRINDSAPFYTVSDRQDIGDILSAKDSGEVDDDVVLQCIFRGDCYLNTFTHRLNRNFQDPDAPNNDIIVDEETWLDNWEEKDNSKVNRGDVNAVKLGSWITFRCYSSMNLALRDTDGSRPEEEALVGHKRGFYPFMEMSPEGTYKIPESDAYNQSFSKSVGDQCKYLTPNVPYIKNNFETRICYSNVDSVSAFKNGFRIFDQIAYRDYSNKYGGLMKLINWRDNLIAIFEHGVGLIPVNEKALLQADSTQIAVGAVKVIPDSMTILSDTFGTQWPESIVQSDTYIYGVDTIGKKIWRTNGLQFDLISDFKVLKFLNDNISLTERELTPIIGVRNVKSHYNAFKHDIMFTFYDNLTGFEEKCWNLCYNEILQKFPTFYSWIPSYSENIDNIFFSYDRNASKWISKLGLSNWTSGNGVVLKFFDQTEEFDPHSYGAININEWVDRTDHYEIKLDLKNRLIPTESFYEITKEFVLERDNFRNDKYFSIINNDVLTISKANYKKLLEKMLTSDPQIPVILLNITCNVNIKDTSNISSLSGAANEWSLYFEYNAGSYKSLVFVTFEKVLNRKSTYELINGIKYWYPKLRTDFWKHGQSGIIDIKERIKPCFWYGKQHPFEFEFIVGNDSVTNKTFDNIAIISNNVLPESVHYTIIGDNYQFANDKKNMYIRQEASKALYQYNGSDILFNRNTFDLDYGILPDQITSSDYIEKDGLNNYLRRSEAVSNIYKATLLPLTYSRQDTFNEVEDYYKKVTTSGREIDYPNLTGCELVWNEDLNQFSLCNHVKVRDIKKVSRMRGNAEYINGRWNLLITPIYLYNRNETWRNNVPPILAYNIPDDIYLSKNVNIDIPPQLYKNDYILGANNCKYTKQDIEFNNWDNLAKNRKEIKLMDTYMKIKMRYKGDQLSLISSTLTLFNTNG